MDLVTILRDLWRVRLLVLGVFILALLAGLAVAFRPGLPPKARKYDVGVATARVLVDTPSSQVVEVAPKGSDTLGVRANLLASLMVDGVVQTAIAHRAGVPPAKLDGVAASAADQPPTAKPSGRGYMLTTRVLTNVDGAQLPIIEIETQAPDADQAAKLANAAVAGLRAYLDSQAAVERVPGARRLRVTGLGAAQAHEVVRGPRNLIGLVVMLFVFGAGCFAILAIRAVILDWRAPSGGERLPRIRPVPQGTQPRADDAQPDLTPVAHPRTSDTKPPQRRPWHSARSAR